MSVQRDELAKVLGEHTLSYWSSEEPDSTRCKCGWRGSGFDLHRVDTILAAGWRKPRTITAVAEIDALPEMSVVLIPIPEEGGAICAQKDIAWFMPGGADPVAVSGGHLPVTVLYTPEEPR
ncbi:hypothetical protein M1M07_07595 [Rhodococcus sp. HM1]|uniref:hypothetical protein n=1 Tax=Rhodococcus sp. HM1 TaxID=2937759 RepID=UPI00200B6CA7|nr:hypothetical protein [Rhodococcus sp. HM1]MCK8670980.1 hypothetical protein [Rhodococcus sp. HM1]